MVRQKGNFSKLQCLLLVIFLTDCATCLDHFTEKPDWIKSCKIYQPEFTKCSTESIQGLISRIGRDEVPEIKAKIGSADPLNLDELIFKEDNNQAVTITANLTDVIVRGFSQIVIRESKVSKKDFSWLTKIRMPKLRIDGKYKMAGKILLIPLNGAGKIFIQMENTDIIAYTKTTLYEKGGFTFYNVTNVKVNIENIDKLTTHLDNIFNGNSKEIEESTNQFFNENWRDFFEALRPLITETVERILLRIMRDIFDYLPANFIVEDIPTSTELYSKKA